MQNIDWKNSSILITGGTGSFGQALTQYLLQNLHPKKLIVFSRDEYKQFQMSQVFSEDDYSIRYFLGDVRDYERLVKAFNQVDYIIHAAALKQVPALEYNPFEAVKTNVLGSQNIINAAIEQKVKKVIALSTDKAVNPNNLYGSTKMVMEKLFVASNVYSGVDQTIFSVVRYGNVLGSRGSILPFFRQLIQRGKKELPLTHQKMTRFWITLNQGIRLVLKVIHESIGGEIFVPKIPSVRIVDIIQALKCSYQIVGIRPGEKLYEILISEDESLHTLIFDQYYIVFPEFEKKLFVNHLDRGSLVPDRWIYRSDSNSEWLNIEKLNILLKDFYHE